MQGYGMPWRTFTKLVQSDSGVSAMWYWRYEVPERVEESTRGFRSRTDCEADALRHNCRPEDRAEERRIAISRLFSPVRVAP